MKLMFLLWIGSLFFFTGCGVRGSGDAPLRIGLMPTMDSVAIATAFELGFFEAHGVAVELIPFSSARDRDDAFLAGVIDGATVDLIAVGLFNEGGQPARATSVTTAHFSLISQAGFTDLASLQDKTVMISHNTAIDFVLDQMLAVYGLPNDYLVREEVGNIPSRFEMVRSNQADAALISEPFATMAAADGMSVITDTFQIDFNPFVLAFSTDIIDNRLDELRSFYLAYEEAVEFLNSEPVESYLDLIVDLVGFPSEVVDYLVLPAFLLPVVPDDKMVGIALEWLIAKGLVSADMEIFDFIYVVDY